MKRGRLRVSIAGLAVAGLVAAGSLPALAEGLIRRNVGDSAMGKQDQSAATTTGLSGATQKGSSSVKSGSEKNVKAVPFQPTGEKGATAWGDPHVDQTPSSTKSIGR